jgi:hypothetical protein
MARGEVTNFVRPTMGAGISGTLPAVPYLGPILEQFSTRTLDPCQPTTVTITGQRLSGITAASVQATPLTIVENTATRLVLRAPAGLTPTTNQPLVISSPSGSLTYQNAFSVAYAAGLTGCATDATIGFWTQAQEDGETIKIYAKNPVGVGKVQFIVDGNEIAWIDAQTASDPKLRTQLTGPMTGVNYLVRTITLKPGKNRIEIRVDGQRVWRVTYLPKG